MDQLCSSGSCPFAEISWLWFTVAVIVSYGIGAVWYSFLFSKKWLKLNNVHCPQCHANWAEGEQCQCKGAGVFLTMSMMFIATAILALLYFVVTPISWPLSVFIFIAAAGWMKATLKFRMGNFRDFTALATIDIGYFTIVSLVCILLSLL